MNLVFASGFLVPQHLGPIEYFKDLEGHLATSGHAAKFPPVPTIGTAATRAKALADAIQQEFPSGEIHIIAHSMAGLDSRLLIGSNLNGLATPGRIVSLTTLSTPHQGSPVADLLVGDRPTDERRQVYDKLRAVIGILGITTGALADLTTTAQFADVAQTHTHIRCRSYGASGRPSPHHPTCRLLELTHEYIRKKTGLANDGLVTVESARYGEFQETWLCDHADMVGHNLDTPLLSGFQFPHLEAFDAIISRL